MYILEDNLRVPSGASYPMIARSLCRRSSPNTFQDIHIDDNRDYADLLRRTMDHVNVGGHTVILTPGRYNAAYFEHSYLAEKTGAHLVNGAELRVEVDKLYYVNYDGNLERVGAVYRRISDEYLDPMNFNPESVIGIPHIYDVFRKGNVAILNAPGNGVADDKGIYYFVPKMIKYYLDEEPVLKNAPTYLPFYEDKWIGMDPTNDVLVADFHIKLGHGRDASVCLINRGVMKGGGDQMQTISVSVEEK